MWTFDPQLSLILRMLDQYAGVKTHSLDSFSLMDTRTSSTHLFKSNSPATMVSMISFPEKVGNSHISFVDDKDVSNSANTGLGFIMLLSGDPGVGKTLTAESG